MNTRLNEVASRLKPLLLMLSSDQPGEVAAAARAIGRTLKSAGVDWHDLAGLLTAKAPARAPSKAQPPPWDDDLDWHEMRKFCLEHSELLRSRELEFIENLADWRGDLTIKQHDWLGAIYARVRRVA
jgi:hypothetical protein